MTSIDAKTNIKRIDTIYDLKPEYKRGYQWAIVEQDTDTGEIIVTLWSNWHSGYNVTQRYLAEEVKAVIRKYRARKRAAA